MDVASALLIGEGRGAIAYSRIRRYKCSTCSNCTSGLRHYQVKFVVRLGSSYTSFIASSIDDANRYGCDINYRSAILCSYPCQTEAGARILLNMTTGERLIREKCQC